jgi:hypothetical protein
MDIEDALELIEDFTVEQLKALTQEDLLIILQGMSAENRRRFFIEKNVKIFGGINQYVDDFLEKTNINSMNPQGRMGARSLLEAMLAYPGVTEENNKLLLEAVAKTEPKGAAPAAGGNRRRKTLRNRRRGLKRSRVRR